MHAVFGIVSKLKYTCASRMRVSVFDKLPRQIAFVGWYVDDTLARDMPG